MSEKSITGHNHAEGLPMPASSATAPQPRSRNVNHTLRTEMAAFLGEFIGTFMFLSLAFSGTQIALNAAGVQTLTSSGDRALPDVSKLLYIAFAFGVSLAINVAIFADVSGGKFNPAVSSAQLFCVTSHPRTCNPPKMALWVTREVTQRHV
jgi:aquaporin related protein